VRPKLLETLLLLECLAAPLLPTPYSAFALLLLLSLWLLLRPPPREVYVAGLALLAAAAILGLGPLLVNRGAPVEETLQQPSRGRWQSAMEAGYEDLWLDLEAKVNAAHAGLASISGLAPNHVLQAFDQLVAVAGKGEGVTLMLFDANEDVIAWAGEGLVPEPKVFQVPSGERSFIAGFGSITLCVARDFPGAQPLRIVAGRSFPAAALPFPPPWPERASDYRWSMVEEPPGPDSTVHFITAPAAPTLVAEPKGGGSASAPGVSRKTARGMLSTRVEGWCFRLAFAAFGLAFLSLAVLRGVGLVVQERPREPREPHSGLQVGLLGIAGIAAWCYMATASLTATAGLVGGFVLTALGMRRYRRDRDHQPVPFKGVGAAALLIGAAWGVQALSGQPLELGGEFGTSPEHLAWRIAFAAAAFGLFLLAGRENREVPEPGAGWAWVSVVLLLGAAAAHDFVPLCSALLVAAGVTLAVWAEPRRVVRRPGVLATTVLLACLASSTAWEMAYRVRLKEVLGEDLMARMAPPTAAQMQTASQALEHHFKIRELNSLVAWDASTLDPGDLAFQLWRTSPLARRNALSALVVRPAEGGEPLAFALGLTLDASLRRASLPVNQMGLQIWDALEVGGVGQLYLDGRPWGEVEYWLQPRPGFNLQPLPLEGKVEGAVLRGSFALGSPVAGLPEPVLYGLYAGDDGRVLITPWSEAAPLPQEWRPRDPTTRVRNPPVVQAEIPIPSGSSHLWVRSGADGWEALYLPRLTPLEALDRVATVAVSVLAVGAIAALLTLLLALPRAAFRVGMVRVLRSYSTRLVIVYTLLLLIPLPLLAAALTTAVEQRLRAEQRTEGEGALLAAQRVLADDLLSPKPGFVIEEATFESRLRWFADAAQHEVIIYWQGKDFASSRPELIDAGVLPQRPPGEVYARLLSGWNLSSRTQRVGTTPYIEIYGPLRSRGEPVGSENFYLFVPLLEQGERVARELAQLRRQAWLVTAALFALLVAVGVRLATNFTRPITELVEGTRRIAAGAPSLDVKPTDLELTVLAEAVDDMARRVAESRDRLLREKHVVERMVEHITSGVVSLDRQQRVLLRNQVAAELTGAVVGEPLAEALERNERLAPVAAFLQQVGRRTEQRTVRLAPDPDEGGQEREWSLVWVPVPGSGEPAALLVVEDATEVLRGQRLQAWAEMARIIAHEIKNPLTPIRLSAEHMREVHQRDPEQFDGVFERCTTNILQQVQELQDIAGDFSTYSSILRAELKPGDLVAVMAALFESYQAAPPPGIVLRFEAPAAAPARLDPRLLSRAIRNLLENAVRASLSKKDGGGEVVLRVTVVGEEAHLAVLDRGPGVPEDILGRIFDPYFSTHDTGTGLGLPIARRVAEEHGGTISARNRAGGGLAVVMALPLLPGGGPEDPR
jgi:signal transduction histidine kinase/HAMP domain-containing protein